MYRGPGELGGEGFSWKSDSVADVDGVSAFTAAPPRWQLGEVQLRAHGLEESTHTHVTRLPTAIQSTSNMNIYKTYQHHTEVRNVWEVDYVRYRELSYNLICSKFTILIPQIYVLIDSYVIFIISYTPVSLRVPIPGIRIPNHFTVLSIQGLAKSSSDLIVNYQYRQRSIFILLHSCYSKA